jgi:outer membrane protein OmpA-like peptidoglycan-associated protein
VVFTFSGVSPAAVTDLETTVESVQADPLVIRFEWGESEIRLTDAERQKLGRIADFMHRSETGVCEVIGHTDNTSSAGFNKELGLKRANFVKDYLVTQGIPQSRIVTRSMGETEPVADNDTEAGRARNRRTVITIRN